MMAADVANGNLIRYETPAAIWRDALLDWNLRRANQSYLARIKPHLISRCQFHVMMEERFQILQNLRDNFGRRLILQNS